MMNNENLLAFVGTGGTFVLTDLNPVLGFTCGILTLVHIGVALYKQNKTKPKPKSINKKHRG